MTTHEFDDLISEIGLSRATIATKTNTVKSTVDSWITKNTYPSWLDSWVALYKENLYLKDEVNAKNITIKELSKLLSSSSATSLSLQNESIAKKTNAENMSNILYCKYEFDNNAETIDDKYKVKLTKISGNRTYCKWLYTGEEGSLSKIAGEIQKLRNPQNQNPSINGNDYFVNSDGISYAEVRSI
ncbi:MAG: hypothetical protein AB7G52_03250 [Arcobacter sp.]